MFSVNYLFKFCISVIDYKKWLLQKDFPPKKQSWGLLRLKLWLLTTVHHYTNTCGLKA